MRSPVSSSCCCCCCSCCSALQVIGTMILGAALAHEARLPNPESFIFFPLVIHALDLIISSVGVMLTTPTSDKEDPLTTMKRAYAICMGMAAVGIAVTCRLLLYTDIAPNGQRTCSGSPPLPSPAPY